MRAALNSRAAQFLACDANPLLDILPFKKTNFPYREIAHTHGILEEPLEAGGPAGHALLWDPPTAAPSWKTAIAVQAALAAASLQLDSTVICKASSRRSV